MNFSELVRKVANNEVVLDPNNPVHLTFIKTVYGNCYSLKSTYEKMYGYYKGNTDAIKRYKFVTERSNLKINVNFIKKFIKEEVSYTVGNKITYESRNDDSDIINDIEYHTSHWKEEHDSDLMKYLLIFSKVYELYYIDPSGDFCSKIINPINGYAYIDSATDKVLFFVHTFRNDFDTVNTYVDIYTDEYIFHYDGHFNQIAEPTDNLFGEVPVSVGVLTLEGYHDSLYSDIKGLQDGFETNFSDISNEISDFRNAYLVFTGCQVDKTQVPDMKKLGVLNAKDKNSTIEWLVKNINDTFIQNTLDRYIDCMYQIACHINHNETMVSNLSGIALRSRLIALENKCELEQKAHCNIIKNRLRFLFKYLDIKKNKSYDYKSIKAIYTPNIPVDNLTTAQMLNQTPEGVISKDTARGLFSFISNKDAEAKKVENETNSEIGNVELNAHNAVGGING